MLFKKSKKQKNTLDLLKQMSVSQEDADRIAGGMMRIENTIGSGPIFIKKSINLARNENEKNLVWYAIGVRIGMLDNLGLVVPAHIYKKMEKQEKEKKDKDPAVQ